MCAVPVDFVIDYFISYFARFKVFFQHLGTLLLCLKSALTSARVPL